MCYDYGRRWIRCTAWLKALFCILQNDTWIQNFPSILLKFGKYPFLVNAAPSPEPFSFTALDLLLWTQSMATPFSTISPHAPNPRPLSFVSGLLLPLLPWPFTPQWLSFFVLQILLLYSHFYSSHISFASPVSSSLTSRSVFIHNALSCTTLPTTSTSLFWCFQVLTLAFLGFWLSITLI